MDAPFGKQNQDVRSRPVAPQATGTSGRVSNQSESPKGQHPSVWKSGVSKRDTVRRRRRNHATVLARIANAPETRCSHESNNRSDYSPLDAASWISQLDCNQEVCASEFFRRIQKFIQYGKFTMAFATLQPGMNYFESHGGYLAYNSYLGATCVLGDPVSRPECYASIIQDFLLTHRRVCFCQISEEVGSILANLGGWYINELGADMELDLKSYDFEGPQKAKLRQAAHKIERKGYRLEEKTDSQVDQSALDQLSGSWLATKPAHREARFMVRPIHFGFEPGVRKFYLSNAGGAVVAFVFFDPICVDGDLVGYSPSVKRRSEEAPAGAEEAILKHAIEQFRDEGVRVLHLGLLPLFGVEQSMFPEAWRLRKLFQWLYRHGGRWIFNFRGQADFKHRFRGKLSKVYMATRTRWGNAYYLIAMMRLCNLL